MKKYISWTLLAFFALGFSKAVLAEVVPVVPAATHDDVVVVFDDDFLQQQGQ